METLTITFGDRAENHKGMEILGTEADVGFSRKDLVSARKKFRKLGAECYMVNLGLEKTKKDSDAYILIIKSGVDYIVDSDDLYNEHKNLKKDTKAFMYGRVVNKHARHNLCFSDYKQKPNYEQGKGTIIAFDDVHLTNLIRKKLPKFLGDKAKNLQAEGNYYYDISKCGIGYHGDSERKCVVGIRLGAEMPLCYQWFLDSEPQGDQIRFDLEHGDIYVMSEKATGNDWKLRSIYTLRHSAGADSFINLKK